MELIFKTADGKLPFFGIAFYNLDERAITLNYPIAGTLKNVAKTAVFDLERSALEFIGSMQYFGGYQRMRYDVKIDELQLARFILRTKATNAYIFGHVYKLPDGIFKPVISKEGISFTTKVHQIDLVPKMVF